MIVRLCLLVCLAVHFGAEAAVTVDNNSYRGLVISFAPEVHSKDGKEIVDKLKNLLEDTSAVLHTAIGLRISDVTFHIPLSWNTSSWENVTPASTPLGGEEDILVEEVVDSAFGRYPVALQYGGCGVPGLKINIPTSFLNDTEGYPKGKLLAREWLKYRYGVFDENGFMGDEMYPSFYQIPGTTDVRITECTDPEVEYEFKNTSGEECSLDIPFASGDCQVHPKESSLNATSSLMYFQQDLKAMESVCGRNHPHKDYTPSKQNLLCNGEDIWKVLQQSRDFTTEETTAAPATDEEHGIQFSYTQEYQPRVVVAFQNSDILSNKKDHILFAVQRFFYDLPEGSEFGLFNFHQSIIDIRPLSKLPSIAERGESVKDLKAHSLFVDSDNDICISCAVVKAVQALTNDSQIQGSVVLIAESTSFKADLVNTLKDLELQKLNLHLTFVALTTSSQADVFKRTYQADVFEDLKTLSDRISLVELHSEEEVSHLTFEDLYDAMRHAVPQSPTTTPTTTVLSGTMSHEKSLLIPMDPTSNKYTLWTSKQMIFTYIQCKAGDKDVTLKVDVQGTDIAAYSFPTAEEDVNCTLSRPKLDAVISQVEMTTKPGEYFTEEVWVQDTSETDDVLMPVIIYARINFGNYPIQDAIVKAEVTGPNNEMLDTLELFDNGRGDPDITQNDGIYSRYFVKFSGAGDYHVTITTENGDSTRVGKNGTEGCCGSKVQSTPFEVPPFTRSVKTSFSVEGAKPEGGFKPSRITDLRVDYYDPMNSITLKWTAPGGEADNGNATTYILKSFTKREDLLTKFNEEGLSISVPILPQNYGSEENFSLPLDDFEPGTTHYLAMRSEILAQNASDISNILEIFIPTDPTKIDEVTTLDPNLDKKQSGMDKQTIGIIIGCLVLVIVLVVVVYLFVYFFVRKPRRKEAKKASSGNSTRNIGSPAIGLNSIPAEAILSHHNEVVSAKSQHKDPPIFREENLDKVEQAPASAGDGNNSAEYSQVQKRQPEQENVTYPPKSPKRMTNV